MNLEFNVKGNDKQEECVKAWINPSITDIVYGGSKGSGKSFLGCKLIFGNALIYPGTHYFIARKNLNDLRRFTIPSIVEVFQDWGLSVDDHMKYNGMDNFFSLKNGSKVFFIDAKYLPSDPKFHRFGSMQFTQGWIEEAGQFDEDAKINLQASLGRWKNQEYNLPRKLLQTCNPQKNYLYFEYYKPFREGTLDDHKAFIQALPTDNKCLPDGYIEGLHQTLDHNSKQRLLFGNWEYENNPFSLIEYDAICDLYTNRLPSTGKKFITCDVARFGEDKTVIMIWDGLTVEKIIVIDKSSLDYVADIIKEYNIRRSNIIIDQDGVGGGLVDMLKGCKPFTNGSKAINGNYQNLKTECYYKLAQMINDGLIAIKDHTGKEQLTQELEVIQAVNGDKDAKLQIMSKDKIKEIIRRSTDYSDALMMRMLTEVKPKVKAVVRRIR